MSSRLADLLNASRRAQFVGREPERELFRSALESATPPFAVLHVHGPGGIGKTSLLREFGSMCEQKKIPAIYFDCRNTEPLPEAFLEGLHATAGLPEAASLADIARKAEKLVLLLDTYETLTPLDDWLRVTFLPQLPENALVVLASRNPPATAWRADPGWQKLMRSLALRNLDPEQSREYLTRRNVPEGEQKAVLAFTHGHPLALSLCADTYSQRESFQFEPGGATQDTVSSLVETFLQKVPGPAHRSALEACALIRVTTESVLGEMLNNPEVHQLFRWLQGLSFIETRPGGLFPHDLARQALVADLRWRNPDWYTELHRRARLYYTRRIGMTKGIEQQRALFDLIYLHRDNPVIQPFFAWQAGGSLLPDALRESDLPDLLEMVARHEGQAAREIAAHWFSLQPGGVVVLRQPDGVPAGFLAMVDLVQATPSQRAGDPAIQRAWAALESLAPLRPGERATHFRFWMDSEAYQSVSAVQSLIFIHIVRHYLTTPGLAFTFFPCADPAFWAPMCAYANLAATPAADYETGDQSFAVFTHDWRAEPAAIWLEILAEREMSTSGELSASQRPAQPALVVLSKPDFANAVWDALRAFKRPDVLAENPLLRSRLVAGGDSGSAGIQELQKLITSAAQEVQETRRGVKFYRALHHTYLQPALTQEQAAELLNLPFSTYRRHLKTGIERITEILWAKEVGGV